MQTFIKSLSIKKNIKMKLLYTTLLSVLLLSFYSCGNVAKETIEDSIPAVTVQVNKVTSENNPTFLTASGVVEAVNSATLSTRMMGFVDKTHVNVGDKVTKGQLLISINNADLSAKQAQANAGITEAQAAYENAEKDYQRFKNLYEDNSATRKELDDMQAHYNMAKARLEGAKAMHSEVNSQFAYADLRAPFNGVVTSRMIEEGDMANPGVPLITIEAPGDYEVMASIPESEISKVKSGTEVNVFVRSLQAEVKGKVTEVSTSAKNTGGQYLVKVKLDSTDKNILSGMYATVRFPVENSYDTSAILIPKKALVHKGELTGIYTLSQSNTAILRWLRLGREYGENVEVLSGLSTDEKYIVSAESKIINGTKLIVKE